MSQPEDILEFWFGASTGEAPGPDRFQLWFQGGQEVDRIIRERFAADVELARGGALQAWAASARGRLALIILIDQFSRNLWRGSAEAFAKDELARALTLEGLENGQYAQLNAVEQLFFRMPLVHSESLDEQNRSLALCEAWVARLPEPLRAMGQGALQHARHHREVIARFGRFPTRNQALGRDTSAEEAAHIVESKAAGLPV
jgi:uncharacterized protein (DUF924 family)